MCAQIEMQKQKQKHTYYNQHHSDINQLLINQYNPIYELSILRIHSNALKSIQRFSIELRKTHSQQININIYDIMPFAISFGISAG